MRPQAPTRRLGSRLPEGAGTLRRVWHYNALSIALFLLFALSMVGQIWSGWYAFNADEQQHGQQPVSLAAYLRSSHFGEATFENWESEFLQMGA